jgi:hypothetical protein
LSINTLESEFSELPLYTEISPLEVNWLGIKSDILNLAEYRISTSKEKWYQEAYMFYKYEVDTFNPKHPGDINSLPKGLLSEVFFSNACQKVGIMCSPCLGEEDIWGADFKICKDDETRFLDVTVNTSQRGFKRKVREGRFPTIFLPWKEENTNNGYIMSYPERYLKYGTFNTKEYFSNVLYSNYQILDGIERTFWKNQNSSREVLGGKRVDYTKAGSMYIKNLEGVLNLLKESLN